MNKISAISSILAVALSSGCASSVAIKTPPIQATDLGSQKRTSGKYAVWVQSGGWKATVDTDHNLGQVCKFPTDFNSAYTQAAHQAFQSAFESPVFVDETIPAGELKKRGLDAQIIIYQGSIAGKFAGTQDFFTQTYMSDVKMDGIVAIIGPAGLIAQQTVNGSGSSAHKPDIFSGGCDAAISPAIMKAGEIALKDFVVKATNVAKIGVLESKAGN